MNQNKLKQPKKIKSTLCYIEQDDRYLMLLRNKKAHDVNEGKWIGIGGKFEPGESADACLLREVKEETGVTLTDYQFRGIIQFVSDQWDDEEMYLYSATGYEGRIDFNCNEGELRWIPKNDLMGLNLWEGDRCFLSPLIDGVENINMTLCYEGDVLKQVMVADDVDRLSENNLNA